jgi:hypothetical protein
MARRLREANHEIARNLDVAFRLGHASAELDDFVTDIDFGRELEIEPTLGVLEKAMERFDAHRAQSDAWVGPRMHSALRLTRREAARRGVWRFLAAEACPSYVRWRWGPEEEHEEDELQQPAPLERFVGPDYKHAFGRLWWMAEVFRDGADYGPAARALSLQDITNNLFRMDIAHHRPTAQAAVNVLVPSGGESLTGREANALAKAINATATTIAIDLIAPDEPLDDAARQAWIADARDIDLALLIRDDLPRGPLDPQTPEASVQTMEALLQELLSEAPVRGRKQPEVEALADVPATR